MPNYKMTFKKGHKTNVGKKFKKEQYPNSGMRRKHHSIVTKKKMSDTKKRLLREEKLKTVFKKGRIPWNKGEKRPNFGKKQKGKKNPNWKGNEVSYGPLHAWVRKYKPKPQSCEKCGKKRKLEIANVSGKYKRDLADYQYLCKSCHSKKDEWILRIKHMKKKHTQINLNKEVKK